MKYLPTFLTFIFLFFATSSRGALCYTNYLGNFTWGANSQTNDVTGLYANGVWITTADYPNTNLYFNISQVSSPSTLTIQSQRGSLVSNGTNSYLFNTNNFPLPVVTNSTPVITNTVPTNAATVWGPPSLGPVYAIH